MGTLRPRVRVLFSVKRRAWKWIAVTVVALTVSPVAWLATRPRVPVVFIGNRPPGQFVFKEDFTGKPFINTTLFGKKITYPVKRKLAFQTVDPDAICGYLATNTPMNPWESIRIKVGDTQSYSAPSFEEDPNPPKVAAAPSVGRLVSLSTLSPNAPALIPLPYATSEAGREVTMTILNKDYKLKLPVTDKYGPAIRKSTTVPCGPYKVTVTPKPWHLVNAPVEFETTVEAPPGVTLFADWNWKAKSTGGFYGYSSSAMLLESGDKVPIVVQRYADSSLSGEVFELAPENLKLRVSRPKKGGPIELYLPDGRCIYGKSRKKMLETFGYKVLVSGGKVITSSAYVQQGKKVRFTFDRAKDGDIVAAVGYRVKGRWKSDVKLDLPPVLKLPTGRRSFVFYGTGGARGTYTYMVGP